MKNIVKIISAALAAFLLSAAQAQLTPGSSVVTGSAIGQISQAQPSSINCLYNTSQPNSSGWTTNGTTTLTLVNNRWDAGFVPLLLAGAGTNNYIQASQGLSCANGASNPTYTFSGQFSTDLTAMYPGTLKSSQTQISILYKDSFGAAIRTDTFTFNPQTGQLVSASSGITGTSLRLFSTTIRSQATFLQTTVPVVAVSFTSGALASTATDIVLKIIPNTLSASGGVAAGAFQLEQGSAASAFIPTPPSSVSTSTARNKPVGTLPTQNITPFTPIWQLINNQNATFDPLTQNGVQLIGLNGMTFNLESGNSAIPVQRGNNVTLRADASGHQFTISTALGTTKIYGPGISTAGVTTYTWPPTAGTSFAYSPITLTYGEWGGLAGWWVSNAVTSSSGGGGTPGGNNTDVQFNNAGVFGGSDKFTWSGSAVTINNNAGTLPSLVTNPGLIMGGADSVANGGIAMYGFGNSGTGANPNINMYRSQGTAASPTALTSTVGMGAINAGGYNGSAWVSNAAQMVPSATQTWTGSANGTRWTVNTTANGSTSGRAVSIFDQDGSVQALGDLYFDGLSGSNGFKLTGTPSAARTITTPDNSGTMLLDSTTPTLPSPTLNNIIYWSNTTAPGTFSNASIGSGLSLSAGVLSATASSAFSGITSGTNTSAAMVVGTGASLTASGSGTITATAVPVGGISGLGSGVGTWLATPSSANLASAVTGTTGTGNLVFSASPALTGSAIISSASWTGTISNATGQAVFKSVAPTISSGFGTSPTIAGGSTAAFEVNVGTGGTANSGVVGLSAATNAWECHVSTFNPSAAQLLNTTVVSARSTTSITLSNFVLATGAAAAWDASQILMITCGGR